MKESDWTGLEEPEATLKLLRGSSSRRKLRYFAIEGACRFRHMLVPETLEALKVAELFAEGQVGQDERRAARAKAFAAPWHNDLAFAHRRGPAKACVTDALARRAYEAAISVSGRAARIGVLSKRDWPSDAYRTTEHGLILWDQTIGEQEERALQIAMLRDIFTTPTVPVAAASILFSPTIVQVAESIYNGRVFTRMNDLADMLEASECPNAEIIAHCRLPTPHCRGCWALDILLGKS